MVSLTSPSPSPDSSTGPAQSSSSMHPGVCSTGRQNNTEPQGREGCSATQNQQLCVSNPVWTEAQDSLEEHSRCRHKGQVGSNSKMKCNGVFIAIEKE